MKENKNVWIWILVAIVLLFFFGNFGMGGYGMMGAGMGFGFLFMILFWGGVIWIIYTLATQATKKNEDPLATLKKRYASGKLSKKQYEQIKKEIRR